jgi:hypothetical protein
MGNSVAAVRSRSRRAFRHLRFLTRRVPQIQKSRRALRHGGVVVQTPAHPASPAILAVVQLDGDIVTFIDPALFERYPNTEARERLLREHLSSFAAALPRLPDPTVIMRALGWGAAGVWQAGALVFSVSAGWSWPAVFAHVLGLSPIALGWAGRPLLLRWARHWARRELRKERVGLITRFQSNGIAAFKLGGLR